MQTHSKNTAFEGLCGKNVDNGVNCCLDSFSGRRRRGYLKGGGNRGPGLPDCGWRAIFRRFFDV